MAHKGKDPMKKTKKLFITFFLGLNLIAAIHAQARLAPPNDFYATAGRGQAEIVINAENADRDTAVWVNGVIVAHVRPKAREKIIVHNGSNVVEAADTIIVRNSHWNIGNKRQLSVTSDSNRITISLNTRYGSLLNLTIQETVALGSGTLAPGTQAPPSATPSTSGDGSAAFSLENAVYRAAQVMINSIPNGATLAVLSIATNDTEVAEFVIEELAYFMVETRKFRVMDRRSLDAVRTEHRFQISGDVDDNSAVSIGKMVGANIVITGSVSGSGATRRLRAKALDVETAEIVAMASERY